MPLLIIVIIVFSPLLVALLRTLVLKVNLKPQKSPLQAERIENALAKSAGKTLAKAVSFKTVSYPNYNQTDIKAFDDLADHLKDSYPLMHSKLEKIEIGYSNLVFKWEGENRELKPALFLAHQDVVPANEDGWIYPPFDSTIRDGFVWGRGSFDLKGQMIAICETVETLLSQNFKPKRSYYIAFGCDEEVRGKFGAKLICAYFLENEITFEYVLDEGGVVGKNFLPGLKENVAVIGVAEKGDLNIKIKCTKEGGHSSAPKNPTPIATLGKALYNLEKKKMRAHICKPIKEMLHTLGLYAPFPLAFVFLNLWLTKPLINLVFSKNSTLNPLIRTTVAATMAKGSEASNVIDPTASAILNVRLLPSQSSQEVLLWAKKRINDDSVTVEPLSDTRRSRISPTDTPSFNFIKSSVEAVFENPIVVPYVMIGGTDAIWYEQVSDCVYRFSPTLMSGEELKRIHNANERLSIENLKRAIEFYLTLIKREVFV